MTTTSKTLRGLLTGLLTLTFLGVGTAHAETTAEEIIFSLTPSQTEAHPEDRVSVRTEIEPGEQFEDAVTLRNFTESPVTFQLSAADGVTSESGAFDVLAPDAQSEQAGTWFELDQETITVEADSEETVGFTITIPENATPGDHPAGITAALADQDEELNVVSRVGVRTHIRVAGEIEPGLIFDSVETVYHPSINPLSPGSLTTRYTISNQGNVRLGTSTTVASAGPFGWNYATSEPVEIREILPGDSVSFETTVDDVWPLVVGTTHVEASPTIVGDDEVEAQLTSTTHEETIILISWTWTALLVLLIIAIVVAIVQRKRRAAKFEAAVAQAAKERTEQPTPAA